MWKPSERKIFKYHNGVKVVGIDPLEADMRLGSVDLNWEERYLTLNLGVAPNATPQQREEALAAVEEMTVAAKKVFRLKDYEIDDEGNETGLTTIEVQELLGAFVAWKEEVRSFFAPTPTSLPPTELGSAEVTANTADCGGTSTVS